jgi:hypothetical protein
VGLVENAYRDTKRLSAGRAEKILKRKMVEQWGGTTFIEVESCNGLGPDLMLSLRPSLPPFYCQDDST